MSTPRKILVAYATKHGSTQEVAEAIAGTLRERFAVDVRPAGEVRRVDEYDGVVLGGSIYMGRWHHDALRLLKRNAGAFATVPLAVFAMGPDSLEEKKVAESRAQLEHALRRVPEVHPARVAIFGGVVHPQEHGFPFNKLPEVDARDWTAIGHFATDVGRDFG